MKYLYLTSLICILLFGKTTFVFAQQDSTIQNVQKISVPSWGIKLNMTSLIDSYGYVKGGVEYSLGYQLSLQHEFGAGTWNNYGKSVNQILNLDFSNQIRMYLAQQKMEGTYITLDHTYRINRTIDEISEEREQGAYYELVDKPITRRGHIVSVRYGIQRIYQNRILIDFQAGLSFKKFTIDGTDDPYLIRRRFTEYPKNGYLSPSLGFRIGYMFYKK